MVKNLFVPEMARRLNVSVGTFHKRAFQRRLGLRLGKIGRRLFCPEPVFEEWVLEQVGVGKNA